MSIVFAALTLGLAGSLHCLGMCGPLVLAVHHSSTGHGKYDRIIYHLSRIAVYTILGVGTGILGKTLITFGFQRWLAIISGVLMLLFLLWPIGKSKLGRFALTGFSGIKSKFQQALGTGGIKKQIVLGALNGLLPCGLVYVALAASISAGSIAGSGLFMALFGLGTSPALFLVSKILSYITSRFRFASYRVVQLSLVCISMLVILRGAGLGIPFLSPSFSETTQKVECCHKP